MKKPIYKKMRLADIRPYEKNPRIIPDEAVDGVAKSIKNFGYMSPICVDQSGVILAGHTTYKAAKKAGLTEVEVVQVEIDETKAKGYRIADNRVAELARWDRDALIDEAAGLLEDAPEMLDALGLADWELERLYADIAAENAPEPAEKPKREVIKKHDISAGQKKPPCDKLPPLPPEELAVKQRCVVYVDDVSECDRFLTACGCKSARDIPIQMRAKDFFANLA